MKELNNPVLLEGEWVVISGAGKGIGRAIAEVFAAKRKNPLLLISRSKDSLNEVVETCRHLGALDVISCAVDLSEDSIEWPEEILKLNVGLIINNAGQFSMYKASELKAEQMLHDWKLNVLPAVHCNIAFLPQLIAKKHGAIFHIVSAAALEGRSYASSYSSAKHALSGYVKSLRLDLMEVGIAVSSIYPGQTYTASWKGSDVDPTELMDAQDLAKMILTMSSFSRRTVMEEVHLEPLKGERAPF